MDTRQQLVEEWKAKLEANSQPPGESGERFAWVRQIYTRIYRFLVSCYGEGDWNADSPSTASHMPFVENYPTTDGLAPKSRERIRAALESIHAGNPGVATPGTTAGVSDDTWVVVAAQKKSEFARAVHRRLVAYGTEARLQNRTTDIAIVVRHKDFQKAVEVVQSIGRPKRIRIAPGVLVWTMKPVDELSLRNTTRFDPAAAIGFVLLVSSLFTFIAVVVLFQGTWPRAALVVALAASWIAGLLASWLIARRHKRR